jgi:hypothetical protein
LGKLLSARAQEFFESGIARINDFFTIFVLHWRYYLCFAQRLKKCEIAKKI